MSQKTTIPRKGQDADFNDVTVNSIQTPVTTLVANYTFTAADSGKLFIAGAADLVLTLPATASGLRFRVSLASAGLSVGTGLSLSPATVDKIMGNGFTAADNKDAICSGASDRVGDFIELTADGVDGYYITAVIGTWAREA